MENREEWPQFPLGDGEHLEALCYASGKVHALRLGPGDTLDGEFVLRLGPEVTETAQALNAVLRAILEEGVVAVPRPASDRDL